MEIKRLEVLVITYGLALSTKEYYAIKDLINTVLYNKMHIDHLISLSDNQWNLLKIIQDKMEEDEDKEIEEKEEE